MNMPGRSYTALHGRQAMHAPGHGRGYKPGHGPGHEFANMRSHGHGWGDKPGHGRGREFANMRGHWHGRGTNMDMATNSRTNAGTGTAMSSPTCAATGTAGETSTDTGMAMSSPTCAVTDRAGETGTGTDSPRCTVTGKATCGSPDITSSGRQRAQNVVHEKTDEIGQRRGQAEVAARERRGLVLVATWVIPGAECRREGTNGLPLEEQTRRGRAGKREQPVPPDEEPEERQGHREAVEPGHGP